jgi:hypothetical protein
MAQGRTTVADGPASLMLAKGFDATVDFPAAAYYPELLARFPAAKVLPGQQ